MSISGLASANEGATVTYTITVTNNGPSTATSTTLTDSLPAILGYKSATTSQGTFSVSGGVVTFALGTLAANGTVTATVVAQALEDGSTSNLVTVGSSSPDPNTGNNTASATAMFNEPGISVSSAIHTRSRTLTNAQVVTFTHASGVEPVSAFQAMINWGDGTASTPGTITLSGTTYKVTGSHSYSNTNRHTITTTVTESGNSPVLEGGNKVDVNPGTLPLNQRDLVRLSDLAGNHDGDGHSDDHGTSTGCSSLSVGRNSSESNSFTYTTDNTRRGIDAGIALALSQRGQSTASANPLDAWFVGIWWIDLDN